MRNLIIPKIHHLLVKFHRFSFKQMLIRLFSQKIIYHSLNITINALKSHNKISNVHNIFLFPNLISRNLHRLHESYSQFTTRDGINIHDFLARMAVVSKHENY